MVDEDRVEAAIAEDGAAEFGDRLGRLQPALGFGVETPKSLQLSILFLG